ncbi:hypothetical protein EDD93_7780 [Streptomyces sp. 840.1]|nr:hypothetical protein [Streptomyces sp. 840.1]ROQ57444.1 hypothetical protein EDD93_7780 [Streptomyces sp. 840.1]
MNARIPPHHQEQTMATFVNRPTAHGGIDPFRTDTGHAPPAMPEESA